MRLSVLLIDCGKKETRLKPKDFSLQQLGVSKQCLENQKRDGSRTSQIVRCVWKSFPFLSAGSGESNSHVSGDITHRHWTPDLEAGQVNGGIKGREMELTKIIPRIVRNN